MAGLGTGWGPPGAPEQDQEDLLGLAELTDEDALARQRLAQALAMREAPVTQRATPLGAGLSGLGSLFRTGASFLGEQRAREQIGKTAKARAGLREAAIPGLMGVPEGADPKAMADALMRRERRIHEASLSGDPVLQPYARTLQEQAAAERALKMKLDQEDREAAAKAQAAKAAAEKKAADDRFSKAMDLRKEFMNAPQTRRIIEVNEARMKVAAASGDGSGDMALLYGYMKLLDPGSAVKGEEFESASKTEGIPGQILALRARIFADGMLPPQARANIKREAEIMYRAHSKTFDPTIKVYRDLAGRYGFDVDEIVPELGLGAKTKAPTKAPPSLTGRGGRKAVLLPDGTYEVE